MCHPAHCTKCENPSSHSLQIKCWLESGCDNAKHGIIDTTDEKPLVVTWPALCTWTWCAMALQTCCRRQPPPSSTSSSSSVAKQPKRMMNISFRGGLGSRRRGRWHSNARGLANGRRQTGNAQQRLDTLHNVHHTMFGLLSSRRRRRRRCVTWHAKDYVTHDV